MRLSFLIVAGVSLALAACGQPKHADGHTESDHAAIATKEAVAADGHAGMDMNMDMSDAGHGHGAPTMKLALDAAGPFVPGRSQTVTLSLTDVATGASLGPDELALAHTKKLHLLIVDASLTDYQHIHPVAGARPGEWTFMFTPRFGRTYKVWADATRKDGDQEYVAADLIAGTQTGPAPDARPVGVGEADGLKFSLSFAGPVKAGQGVMGSVAVIDSRTGQPFTQLQPIMGAFGHVVAFSRDWSAIEHVHPQGVEPKEASDRSGPVIDFHIEPRNPGVLKIFVQVMAKGREIIVPFTVNVEA